VKRLFKNDKGKPLLLTNYQEEIVKHIIRRYPRKNLTWSATRAGKSLSFAIGIILLCIIHKGSKVRIIGPTTDHCRVIMNYIIQHLLDHESITEELTLDTRGMTAERLKKELSKRRITWKNNSEIMIISADIMQGGRRLIGEGGTDIFIEEAEHIPSSIIRNNVMRMLGDDPDSTIHMITNPVRLGYMYERREDQNDDSWNELKVTWQMAVAEGRLTHNFIMQRKAEMTENDFTMWYCAEYPEEIEGALIRRKLVDAAVRDVPKVPGEVEKVLGVDVARFGADLTVLTWVDIIEKGLHVVRKIRSFPKKDTMQTVGLITDWDADENFNRILIDDTGVGGGVTDRLREFEKQRDKIFPFVSGESPDDPDDKTRFINKKVQHYTRLANLFEKKSIIIPEEPVLVKQLKGMRYEISDSTGKRKVVDPEDGKSPDFADSLMIACSGLKPKHIIVDMT